MGEGFGQLHGDSSDQAGTLPGARLQGLIGGYQIGYNFHLPNNLVLGAEADVSFGSFSGMTHRPPLTFGHYDANFDYFGTARARAGWAMGRLLPYLTSGLAWGRHKVAFDSVDGETHGLLRTHWGWTVGAGLEYAVDGHWTLKGEFLYADFNRRRYGRLFFGEAREAAVPFRPSVSAFKLGLNYKFQDGWAAASTAKPILKPPAWITPDDWSIHAQTTFIWQGYPRFRSPYEGEHSLFGGKQARNTWSVTGFIGRRLWEGAELYVVPELAQGGGLSGTVGLGGFANGEAQKAGFPVPHPNFAHAFIRQTFDLGGEQEQVPQRLHNMGGAHDVSRLTFTIGKMSVLDHFDDNAYAHDPRTTFLNWSIWAAGAFDYAADQVGYTWGAVADLNQRSWAVRAGYFMMPRISNVNQWDGHIPERGSAVVELEKRYSLFSQPGKLRLLVFLNRTNSGSYRETLDTPPFDTDIARTWRTRTKYGYAINLEQAVSDDVGLFARWSWNNGKNEIMSFTDIDASLSGGTSIAGTRWGRPYDKIGIGGAINALSADHRDFIAAGGLGPLIGDGRLNYRTERVLETFYSLSLRKEMALTFDYQFITNPAYNADRGPVSIFTARYHAEY